jgi:hypothetical protein
MMNLKKKNKNINQCIIKNKQKNKELQKEYKEKQINIFKQNETNSNKK